MFQLYFKNNVSPTLQYKFMSNVFQMMSISESMIKEINGFINGKYGCDEMLLRCEQLILKQDPWEVLASFIITQNCHVSRARKIVGELCNRYGTEITNTDLGVKFKTFPSPAEILKHGDDIARMGIGYRDYYLLSAAECVDSRPRCCHIVLWRPSPNPRYGLPR